MHFLRMSFRNARHAVSGSLQINRTGGAIAKWTLLDDGPRGREALRLIAAACGGTRIIPRLGFDFRKLCRNASRPLQVELILGLCSPYEACRNQQGLVTTGIRLNSRGEVAALSESEIELIRPEGRFMRVKSGIGSSASFILAYGSRSTCHQGADDFDFSDPYFRARRIHSLFSSAFQHTDPVAFLTRLHYRGIRWKRTSTYGVLQQLAFIFCKEMDIAASCWLGKSCNFSAEWAKLNAEQKRIAGVVLDAVRHMLDAHQRSIAPLNASALILFDRPDRCCTRQMFPHWARLMDALLPSTQFVITVDKLSRCMFPQTLYSARCALPAPEVPSRKTPSRLPPKTVVLVDLDSRLPNLALMKLSRFFKDQKRKVVLARRDARFAGVECIYASGIFSTSSTLNRLSKLRGFYGDALIAGGTGIDLKLRLPSEVESLAADYSLYPELGDRAIGFLTRGCPFKCPFCVVPAKEGGVRQVCTLDELVTGQRRKLILLDDNILSHPNAKGFLEEMAQRGLAVNFNQTLDLRFVDKDIARLLRRVQCSNVRFTRRAYHFSLKDNRNLDEVRRKYEMFGFTRQDNVEFVCMYRVDTTLEQDVERFRFLRSLPGAYVFVQPYLPFPGSKAPNLSKFLDERADIFIDELIRIIFPQNMKSMESYYRWVSKLYAEKFGKPHMPLVDTIFRYNQRERRGHYLAALCNGLDEKREDQPIKRANV